MKSLFFAAIAAFGLTALAPASQAILSFDQPGLSGGTLSFDGVVGSALEGRGITFDQVTDSDSGEVLDCSACVLDFDTGASTSNDPFAGIQFGAGGFFTLSGSITDPDNGNALVATGTLLDGVLSRATFSGSGTSGLFIGVGEDEKNPDLLDFLGIGATDFVFVNSEIALQGCDFVPGPGFACAVTNADIDNAAAVSEPPLAALLGLGMLGLAGASYRKRAA